MSEERVVNSPDGPRAGGAPPRPVAVWAAIVALILLAVVRSAVATRADGFTVDEAYHITAGVSYVKLGDYRLNPEHPPLVKLWVGAALAPTFNLPPLRPLADKAAERDFNESAVYLANNPDAVRARARVAMWALNGLLLLFLALAVSRALRTAAALFITVFLAIDPTVAAHLPVVLTDLPVALLAAAAVLFMAQALRSGRRLDALLAAVSLGLTLGAKHSGLIALLAVGACGGVVILLPKIASPGTTRVRTLALTLTVVLGALFVLWGLYGFRYTETASGEEAFNRPLALKLKDVRSTASRRALGALANARLLPRSYIWGLADTIRAGVEGRGIRVFFFGHTYRDRGPVYYFPAVLAAKLPLGLLALAIAGLFLMAARKVPRPWLMPGAALALLSLLFLITLARGVSYGGIRHALPVVVVLAVFGGMASASAFAGRSRPAKALTALALAAAAASALPRARPWEYFNELFGGPQNGHLRFGDEGVDMGQRTLDFVRYYRERLEPAGEVPYLFYPMAPGEQQRRGVRARGERGTEGEAGLFADVSGTFFLSSVAVMRNPRYQAFRDTPPAERIGNLFIYRGTFHLPWLLERRLLFRANRLLIAPEPDLDKAEGLLREALALNPKSFIALMRLGNIALRRGQREEAVRLYERAGEQLGDEEQATREALARQVQRLSSGEPLEKIPPVRGMRAE